MCSQKWILHMEWVRKYMVLCCTVLSFPENSRSNNLFIVPYLNSKLEIFSYCVTMHVCGILCMVLITIMCTSLLDDRWKRWPVKWSPNSYINNIKYMHPPADIIKDIPNVTSFGHLTKYTVHPNNLQDLHGLLNKVCLSAVISVTM